jgi:hypothetical protein
LTWPVVLSGGPSAMRKAAFPLTGEHERVWSATFGEVAARRGDRPRRGAAQRRPWAQWRVQHQLWSAEDFPSILISIIPLVEPLKMMHTFSSFATYQNKFELLYPLLSDLI